jgi:predicted dehydrogenase
MSQIRCLIVGAGPIGRAHGAAVKEIHGADACALFGLTKRRSAEADRAGLRFLSGDLADAVRYFRPTHWILATPVEQLANATGAALELGAKRLLVEKPGALFSKEGQTLDTLAKAAGASVRIAYNRRYYASTREARRRILASGEAITSVYAEFTEWGHQIGALTEFSAQVKARWAVANSLHVLDLAFLPTGLPRENTASYRQSGTLPWHPSAARMNGTGVTESGALFTCWADWESPGRWGVEWLTPSVRYIFRPMERLSLQKRGSLTVEEVELPDADVDQRHKPGFLEQARDFLSDEAKASPACSLEHSVRLVRLAETLCGYDRA